MYVVYFVYLVYLVYVVHVVYFVHLVQKVYLYPEPSKYLKGKRRQSPEHADMFRHPAAALTVLLCILHTL